MLARCDYDRLSTNILHILAEGDDMTMNTLLERVVPDPDSDVSWQVLQIKLDLEARGFIKVYTPLYEKRLFYLKLTSKGQKQVRDTQQSEEE